MLRSGSSPPASLQVVADKLIEALAEGVRLLSGASYSCSSMEKVTFTYTVYVHMYPVVVEGSPIRGARRAQGTAQFPG